MSYADFSNPKGGYNPLNAVNTYRITPSAKSDPPRKGDSIIFFVNGHWDSSWLGKKVGPAFGGILYWKYFNSSGFSLFLLNAAKYFKVNTPVDFRFIDGSSIMAIDDSGQERKDRGEEYAKINFDAYKDILLTNKIYIVSHSEGGAFATGMAKYFVENGMNAIELILLACDEADEFKIDFKINAYQIELMFWILFGLNTWAPFFDWVINSRLKDGGVLGVTKYGVIVDKNADGGTVHAGNLINPFVFERIQQLKNVRVFKKKNPKNVPFNMQAGSNIKFYQIDKNIIDPNHPNWNPLTKEIQII